MINDKRKLISYLDTVIDKIFKVLPLFEEKNIGLNTYVDSLLFELYGLERVFSIEDSREYPEYVSLLATLETIKHELYMAEIHKGNMRKSVLRRELFKCINIVKNMVAKIEKGV